MHDGFHSAGTMLLTPPAGTGENSDTGNTVSEYGKQLWLLENARVRTGNGQMLTMYYILAKHIQEQ